MSIKFVHLAFMTVCTLFCMGVGVWALVLVKGLTGTGIFFAIAGLTLLGYTVHFFKKWRKLGFFL